jgi:hypothetical protein
MKKLFAIAILGITLLTSSSTAFAANNVSNLAVTKGGQAVAECARNMDRGISNCVTMSACNVQ